MTKNDNLIFFLKMTDKETKDPTLGAVETFDQPDFGGICENGEFNLFNVSK